ncbi:MAG TPA: hypothetical protein VMR76_01590 [Candidatus Saccharimonadia bacterium]|nr:hypothetical protein [Candidatus Saccharimonadia bacterium]
MSTDEFEKLLSYIQKRFDQIVKTLESKASSEDMQRAIALPESMSQRRKLTY